VLNSNSYLYLSSYPKIANVELYVPKVYGTMAKLWGRSDPALREYWREQKRKRSSQPDPSPQPQTQQPTQEGVSNEQIQTPK